MGASLLMVSVSGDGDRAGLHDIIWYTVENQLRKWGAKWWSGDSGDYIGEMIIAEKDAGDWGVDGDQLVFSFNDYAGCCSTSASLWYHWAERILAYNWARVQRSAEQRGLSLVGEAEDLGALLAGDRHRFLRLRNNWWSVNEMGLSGDDKFIPLADLTESQRAKHTEAMRQCLCELCRKLRTKMA